MADETTKPPVEQQTLISPDKFVPKFCSGINFSVLNNQYVVISLMYAEPNNPAVLVERVMIDIGHAKKVTEVLQGLLSNVEKKGDPDGKSHDKSSSRK